jgi:predicted patatin/cPLA2 family phospholipase
VWAEDNILRLATKIDHLTSNAEHTLQARAFREAALDWKNFTRYAVASMGWKPLICIQGGGARGAWQAGVLEGLLESPELNPPVAIWGTSAGAINAFWASTACEKAVHGHLLVCWLAFARRISVAVAVSYLMLMSLFAWCAAYHGFVLICLGVLIAFVLIFIAKINPFGIRRLPGLLSIRLTSKFIPCNPHPARWYAYFFAADVSLSRSPESWSWDTVACFELKPAENRSNLILPRYQADLDPRIAVMCSAALPTLFRPLSFGSHSLLDGGLEANLPAGHLLSHGMSGGNCAICIVPRPISRLDPCDHIDFRTLKFLTEMQEGQRKWRSAVKDKTSSSHPAHTLRPILLIQPDHELKSGIALGFFCRSIMRQEFEDGYQHGKRLSKAVTQFKLGNDNALSAYLLESFDLPELSSQPPKAGLWKYWANSGWA